MEQSWLNALYGGLIIGIAVSLLLLFNGRIAGISGILNGLLAKEKPDKLWRLFFIAGLLVGGLILKVFNPIIFDTTRKISILNLIIAGLCVGVGTAMSGGCTSGHGVCGISRLSIRSIVATMTFIVAGVAIVFLIKYFGFQI